jgi:hypothetical protein
VVLIPYLLLLHDVDSELKTVHMVAVSWTEDSGAQTYSEGSEDSWICCYARPTGVCLVWLVMQAIRTAIPRFMAPSRGSRARSGVVAD